MLNDSNRRSKDYMIIDVRSRKPLFMSELVVYLSIARVDDACLDHKINGSIGWLSSIMNDADSCNAL